MRLRLWCMALLVATSLWGAGATPPTEAEPLALPARGALVSLAQIKRICERADLMALWQKIERDPPPVPFSSDGCTAWVDQRQGKDLYPACFMPDLKYWAGYPGEEVARLVADAEFMIEVARIMEGTVMAKNSAHHFRGDLVADSRNRDHVACS